MEILEMKSTSKN